MISETSMTVEERLNRIENAILKLSDGLNQAPQLVSIATDSVDDMILHAKHNGVDVDGRLKDGLKLLGRLSDPKVSKALNGLLDFLEQSPGLVSMGIDTVDETIAQSNNGSVRLDDRIKTMTKLLNKITDPEIGEKIDSLMKFAEEGPGLMAMAIDTADDFMDRHGEEFRASMEFMNKENLLFLRKVAQAFTEAQSQTPAKVGGIFGMMRVLKDAHRQKSLGFLMNVLKNLGMKI